MNYNIAEDAEAYFLNQIKFEKRRLGYFIPGCLFLLFMFWAKSSSYTHRPWYIFILSSSFLLYVLVAIPIIQGLLLRKVIRTITMADDTITFECFDFLFFNATVLNVPLNNYQVSPMTVTEKRGRLLKYSPVLQIKIADSNQLFFYLPSYFDNDPDLTKALEQALSPTI